MSLGLAVAVTGILGILGGCVPRDAAPASALPGEDFAIDLPAECRPHAGPQGTEGTEFCNFGTAGRHLRIVLAGTAGPPELVAGVAISPTGDIHPQLRQVLRRFYGTYLAGAAEAGPDARVARSTARIDAGQAARGGFDDCLRYARGLDIRGFATDEAGVICVNYNADTGILKVAHVAYLELRPRKQPMAGTFDREADNLLRTLRRAPIVPVTSYQRVIPGNP
ncbi:MAG: hypothetical protein U1E59_14550 [Amaricoccus sp.]